MSTPELTPWATTLRERYLAGEASLFLITGNVRDLLPWRQPDGSVEWVELRTYLTRFLERTRDVIVTYDVAQGLGFSKPAHEATFRAVVDARRKARGEPGLRALPHATADMIGAVEDLLTAESHSSAILLDYFEMIAPNAELAHMSDLDKANLVALMRWSSDPAFLATDNLVLLVAEHLSDVNRRLVASPQLATLQVPFPDLDTRRAYLASLPDAWSNSTLDQESLARVTAGLSLLQIRGLLRSANLRGEPISFERVTARKKAIIEQECFGLVELVPARHSFDHVGGMEGVKAELSRVAEAVRRGRVNRVPMGMIFVGPMGTGKTFVAEAFAAESGLTCLKLKNFRDRWVGSTEANLEKVLDLVDALGYVLLIVDEADRGLAASGENDGGVGSRVIARLKEYMSDTSHRGKVLILMMTNRPDKIDVDLKRPGRFDLKIPFFFPETEPERLSIFQALCRKNKLSLAADADLAAAAKACEGYSGAELEAVLLAAAAAAGEADHDEISAQALEQAVSDVIPSRDTRMLAYMEMLAVFESSSKRMLPERLRAWDTDAVQAELDRLRSLLGWRAS